MLRGSAKFLCTIAVVLSLAAVSHAQLFTLQGGNFQVAGVPVANGSVILTLSNPSATICVGGGASTPSYTINLDANGNMPLTQVLGNAALCPQGTFYTAQLFSGANGTGSLISTSTWPVGPSAPYAGTLYPSVMVLPAVSFSGGVVVPSATIAFSATPTFNAATVSKFYISLTGNVTSSTLTGSVKDQLVIFVISQDGVGSRTFAWPTNVKGQAIASGAGLTSTQAFTSDGTNLWPIGEMTVSSGNVDVRANNVTDTGTLAVTGTSTLANVTMGAGNTLSTSSIQQVSATTALCIKDNAGVCHVFIAGVSPFTNLFLQGNGSGVVFLGSAALASVADTTGNINTAGNITSTQTGGGSAAGNTAKAAAPFFAWDATGQAADQKWWDCGPNGLAFICRAVNDANSASATWLTVNRGAGATISSLVFGAGGGSQTLFTATDQIVGRATTDTLTNKTLTSPTITGTAPFNRLRSNQGSAVVSGDFVITGLGLGSWGTTASIVSVSGTDTAGSITIACAGTGQSTNPAIRLTFHDGAFAAAPFVQVSRGDGNSPTVPAVFYGTATTSFSFGLNGTCVAGTNYVFSWLAIGQ